MAKKGNNSSNKPNSSRPQSTPRESGKSTNRDSRTGNELTREGGTIDGGPRKPEK